MYRHHLACALLLSAALAAVIPVHAAADETAHTAAAVIAVDNHWSQAEIHGDTAFLDQLLLPEYRSVSAHGLAIGKADILERARLNGSSFARRQRIVQYMQTHPFAEAVAIRADTALLTFYSPKLGPQRGIWLANVFLFENGAWRAFYSQHTDARR